jgi:hypothetical protein
VSGSPGLYALGGRLAGVGSAGWRSQRGLLSDDGQDLGGEQLDRAGGVGEGKPTEADLGEEAVVAEQRSGWPGMAR